MDSHQGPKSGKFVDMIGFYEPKTGTRRIDADKAKEWIAKGVQTSATVHNMLVSQKVIDRPKITVQKPKKEVVKEEAKEEVKEAPAVIAAPVAATPASSAPDAAKSVIEKGVAGLK